MRFARQLAALADKCDQLGLAEQAQATRAWIIPRDPRRQYLFVPPESDSLKLPATAPRLVTFWHRKLTEYRAAQAESLFALAGQAIQAHRPTLALRLMHEVLRENPGHVEARRILGYRKLGGHWRRSGMAQTVRTSRVTHSTLPWRSGRHWRAQTAHFDVVTDHGPQMGLKMARQLEELYSVWQQLFLRYWTSETLLAQRVRGGAGQNKLTRRHRVVLFKNREEYVAYLKQFEPNIAISLGYYFDARQTAYFFAGDDAATSTWFHEATHQLFQETRNVRGSVGEKSNFWIVEGVALYMESLAAHEGYYTVGGIDADRLQFARYRLLSERFYVPLAKLVEFSREELQTDEEIRRLYGQAAGLTHFLMDDGGGRHRDALVDYLIAVYEDRSDRGSLARATGASLEELDEKYRRFLNVTDADLAHLARLGPVRKLCLGHTDVTDKGLATLADVSRLTWLDLAYANVTDAAVLPLANAGRLTQLNLEHTQITDAALSTIGGLAQLEELDLSGTQITDAGLAKIAGLKGLTVLWLTDTPITDAGLVHLRGLTKLEMLDVSGSGVTEPAWDALRRALPSLTTQ